MQDGQSGGFHRPVHEFIPFLRLLLLMAAVIQFDHEPGFHGGGFTQQEIHMPAVNSAMRDPRRRHDGRRQMVREICSFDDGRSTVRVNDVLQRFLVKSGSGHDPAPADLVGAQLWGS